MSYIPPQEYELGTVWVPFYSNGQIFMIPIRPKPIQPNPRQPKPYTIDPIYYREHIVSDPGTYSYDHEWYFPPTGGY